MPLRVLVLLLLLGTVSPPRPTRESKALSICPWLSFSLLSEESVNNVSFKRGFPAPLSKHLGASLQSYLTPLCLSTLVHEMGGY